MEFSEFCGTLLVPLSSNQIEILPLAYPQDAGHFLILPHWPLSSKTNPLRAQNSRSILRLDIPDPSSARPDEEDGEAR